MFTTGEDWVERLKAVDGSVQVDGWIMAPSEGVPLSPECKAIWREIQGLENETKWQEAEEAVRLRTGPVGLGWTIFNPFGDLR
jgi:hypothetical protein